MRAAVLVYTLALAGEGGQGAARAEVRWQPPVLATVAAAAHGSNGGAP